MSGGAAGEPRRWVLYNEKLGKRKLSAWAGGIAEDLPIKLRPARLDVQRTLAIRSFTHEDGSPLRDGDVLIIQPCADDFDDVTVNKEPGISNEVRIHIVGRNGMEDSERAGECRRAREKVHVPHDPRTSAIPRRSLRLESGATISCANPCDKTHAARARR